LRETVLQEVKLVPATAKWA